MERLLRGRVTAALALVTASGCVPAAAMHRLVGEGQAPVDGWAHLLMVTSTAAIALVAAVALLLLGARRGDGRSVLVGGAFATMAALLAVHGLATPGTLLGANGVVAMTGAAALPMGGALLALTALPGLARADRLRRVLAGEALVVFLIAIGATLTLLSPDTVPALPQSGSPLAWALLVAGLAFYGPIALRAVRTFTLTRRRTDLAVVVGVVWLGAGLVPTLLLAPMTWAWWSGHVLKFAGLALVGVPAALDLSRGAPSRPLTGELRAPQLVAVEEAYLGPRVRALLSRLGEHDPSTAEHTRRVALWAVRAGEVLGLAPGRLRELALAGLLHDMGKLGVPGAVLRKPGPLDDDERKLVNRHPTWGDELLAELGFRPAVRRMVHDHHERLDGGGYPRGLRADALCLETRILSVCDVFDAVTSPRAYRPAPLGVRGALDLLHKEAGTAFDPRCIAALQQVLHEEGELHADQAALAA